MLERVTKTVREHEMLAPGELILVSCSGGPDSVCLLYSLWHLRWLFKIRLAVFHLDHRLRPDSAKDAAYVRTVARRLTLPFHLRSAEDAPIKGESVEAWAREARQAAGLDIAEDIDAARIAEGHTVDDQAETVLMAAITGSGMWGLTGIWPSEGSARGRIQPMIDVTRQDVEAFCRALHLRPRRDPSNRDVTRLRNAIRLEAMPVLERATGREIRRPLARVADQMRPVAMEQLAKLGTRSGSPPPFSGRRGEYLELAVALFDHQPPLRVQTSVRDLLKYMRLPVSKEAVDGIIDLANGRPGRRRDLPEGLKGIREKEYVRVSRPSLPSPGPTSGER